MLKKIIITLTLLLVLSVSTIYAKNEYKEFADSENFIYSIEETGMNIKVKSKNTGEIYSSKVDDISKMNNIYANMAQSGITIEYADEKNDLIKISSNDPSVKKTYTYKQDKVTVALDFTSIGLQMEVILEVDNNDQLIVSIPGESIKESDPTKPLVNIYVFPFLGANNDRTLDGYMFIPDGSGAIISYDEVDKNYSDPYMKKIYGEDVGYQSVYDEEKEYNTPQSNDISVPVYGIVNEVNKMGFWARVSEGEENAMIYAVPTEVYTDYFWTTQIFNYREEYYSKVNKKGDGYYTYPAELEVYDAQVVYNFQQVASYSSFAKGYQEYLVENGILVAQKEDKQPFLITVLGIEKNKTQPLGPRIVLTNIEQLNTIITELEEMGINPHVVVEGWQKGGYTSQSYDDGMDKKFGTESEFDELIAAHPESEIYLSSNVVISDEEQFLDNSNNEAMITYDNFNGKYLVDSNTAIATLQSQDQSDLPYAYNDIFRFLYSSNDVSNTEMKEQLEELELEKAPVTKPNAYGLEYTSDYIGMEPQSTGESITSQDVPFLPMVLSGYITMFSTPINLQPEDNQMYLQLIEYNIYPNYYITFENPYALINSDLDGIYTSQFDLFKEEIVSLYNFYTPFYEATNGAEYINHETIKNGAICTYSNGAQVYINYSDSTQTINGVEVEGLSYEVVK